MHKASRNACLCKKNPCALMGRVVSQVDAPFSEANSTAFWSVGGSEFFKVVDVSCCFSRRCFLVSPFSSSCTMYMFGSGSVFCPVHSATIGSVMECEALCCSATISVRIGIPSPPSLAGSALMLLCPVMAGRSLNHRASSIGCSLSPRYGTTRIK